MGNRFPSLTKRQAEVYDLHEKKQMKHDEIGEVLGISTRTSEDLLYKARKQIMKCRETLENI